MSLIDNNSPLDGETIHIIEQMLVAYLEECPPGRTLLLSKMYADFGIEQTPGRMGTLDGLIEQTLYNWNWQKGYRGWDKSIVTYERHKHPRTLHVIQLIDGTRIETGKSWPYYYKPRPRDPIAAAEVRVRINAARK